MARNIIHTIVVFGAVAFRNFRNAVPSAMIHQAHSVNYELDCCSSYPVVGRKFRPERPVRKLVAPAWCHTAWLLGEAVSGNSAVSLTGSTGPL